MFSDKKFWIYFVFVILIYAVHTVFIFSGFPVPIFFNILFIILIVHAILVIVVYFLIIYIRVVENEEQFKETMIKLKLIKGFHNIFIGFLLVNAYAVQYMFSGVPIVFIVYLIITLFIIYDSKKYDKYMEDLDE